MRKFFIMLMALSLALPFVFMNQSAFASAWDSISPTTPTNLYALEISDSFVRLRWNRSSDNVGVKSYEIYMNQYKIGEVSSEAARVSNLSPNQTYSFKVLAKDFAGNRSAFSNTYSLKTKTQAPPTLSAPQNLIVNEVSDTFVRIGWSEPTDASLIQSYGIYLNDKWIGKVSSTRARINHLTPNTIYTIKVVSLDSNQNQSVQSETVALRTLSQAPYKLSAPKNLTAIESTQTLLRFKWEPGSAVEDVLGYDVYVNSKWIGSVTGTSARIRNLTPDTIYDITVVAYDALKQKSPISGTLSMRTLPTSTTLLNAPDNLRAIEINPTWVRLRWDAPTGDVPVTSYIVYRNNVEFGRVSAPGALISNLTPGSSHSYQVAAIGANSTLSGRSNLLTVTTPTN
jgi:chitodextrinase